MKHTLAPAAIAERTRSLFVAESEHELATKLAVPTDILRRYLQDEAPDPVSVVRIAELADVPIEWLLEGTRTGVGASVSAVNCGNASVDGSPSRTVPPPVNLVLNHSRLSGIRRHVGSPLLVQLIRDEIRQGTQRETSAKEAAAEIAAAVASRANEFILPSRALVNATGVIIHTGWGNSPLHRDARERMLEASGATATGAAYAPSRTETCARLLKAITGAEAATVTTLNAASYLLLAGALAAGREIVVAARDLVEISEGARIADILESAGARVVPVGSANCVYIEDYRRALTPQTAMIMRIHASNISATGYVAHVEGRSLSALADQHNLPCVENLGGGSLVDITEHALPWCPTLQHALGNGAHLVLASADKIIGGPQAGIIVGKRDWIARISRHPLARTCRPAKLTLAALEATLAVYLSGRAWNEIPTLRLLEMPVDSIHARAITLAERLSEHGLQTSATEDTAECGGAVLPGVSLPTWTVRVAHPKLREDQLHALLLARGVISRRKQGAVLLDLRSVQPEDDILLERSMVPHGATDHSRHAES